MILVMIRFIKVKKYIFSFVPLGYIRDAQYFNLLLITKPWNSEQLVLWRNKK